MRFLLAILLFLSFNAEAQIIRAHPLYRPAAINCTNLLLDNYTGNQVAISLRKLKCTYTGPLVRIRRSNDNAEQDISATSNGDIDTTAIQSFVSSNSAYVVIWYNQSGFGDATNSTASQQARIVNAGTIERVNGKVAVYADGGDIYSIASLTLYTYNATFVVSKSNTAFLMIEHSENTNSNDGFYFYQSSEASWFFNRSPNKNFAKGSSNWAGTNQVVSSLQYNSSGGVYYKNGTSQSNVSVTGSTLSNTQTTQNLYILSRSGFVAPLTGYFQELLLWDSDQSANRTAIEANINSYYSVY